MKNLFFFLLLCTTISFSACSKEEDEVADFVTATIDGSDFKATNITAIGNSDLDGLVIFIAGRDGNSDGIGLNISADTPLNTTLQVEEFDFAITFIDEAQNAFFTVGEVTVTQYDAANKEMEGNFSFTATQDGDDTNVREITNGSFKVTHI